MATDFTGPSASLTNGYANGHGVHIETTLTALQLWQAPLFVAAETFLRKAPEYRDNPIPAEALLEPLTVHLLDIAAIWQADHKPPPPELGEQDVRDECERLARLAIETWCNYPIVREHPAQPPANKAQQALELPSDEPPPMVEVLELPELYSLIDEWDRQPWIWDGILPHSALSLIVGKSETGKSTLIYSLMYSIVRGLPFLGRACEQGRVLYLAGDPSSEIVAGKLFREIGIESGITVMRGALVTHPQSMKFLRETVQRVQPILVIADTLAATVALDTDKYGQSYQSQQPLSAIAREFKPNFLMSHHSQKSAIDSYSVIDAALGSVGVAAVAGTRMSTKMYRRKGEKFYTFEMSNLRLGRPLEGEMIIRRNQNGLVEAGDMWRSHAVTMDKAAILAVLERRREGLPKRTLWGELRPKPKWEPFNDALDELFTSREIVAEKRHGRGGGELIKLGAEMDEYKPN